MINVDHHFHENYSTIFGRFLQFLPIFRDPDGHCWDARKRSVRNLLQRTEGRKPMRRLSGAPKDIVRLANSLVNGLIFGPKNGQFQNSLCQISCQRMGAVFRSCLS